MPELRDGGGPREIRSDDDLPDVQRSMLRAADARDDTGKADIAAPPHANPEAPIFALEAVLSQKSGLLSGNSPN